MDVFAIYLESAAGRVEGAQIARVFTHSLSQRSAVLRLVPKDDRFLLQMSC